MPSFADSAVIFILALMLFGPKKLPQLARQLGKLMAEFRRASNEFRMQMEDELRIEEQKEHQKKVDAIAGPPSDLPDPEHPHLPATTANAGGSGEAVQPDWDHAHEGATLEGETTPVASTPEIAPIAESGSLRMMPPSTGLPVQNGSSASTGHSNGFAYHDPHHPDSSSHDSNHAEAPASIEEHTVPEHTILPPAIGMSSEEPLAEASHPAEQTHA